ncbi:hypothetical protein ACFQ1S_17145, partial [Kibdelosporangium lantanae]
MVRTSSAVNTSPRMASALPNDRLSHSSAASASTLTPLCCHSSIRILNSCNENRNSIRNVLPINREPGSAGSTRRFRYDNASSSTGRNARTAASITVSSLATRFGFGGRSW